MEYYDVIIVGAGIAGCGLAYNLKRIGYQGSVLIIDKKEVGANSGYGYRNTNAETVKQFGLVYEHIFDGIKIGTYDKTYLTINRKFYFIDYKKSCEVLLAKSGFVFKKEEALDVLGNTLISDVARYGFKYFVDASGHNFFTRRKLNKPLPFRYWVGKTHVLDNELKLENYFYHQFSDSEYLEDLYLMKNKILHGDWYYAKRLDFDLIKRPEKTLFSKYMADMEIKKTFKVAIPCAHVPPQVRKNYVCLGDSFGNAYTSSACGIQSILESSAILASAIEKRDISLFEKEWKEKYLSDYNKFLVSKLDTYHNSKLMILIKKYPTRTQVIKLMKNDPLSFLKIFDGDSSVEFPVEIKNLLPKRQKLFQLFHWIQLNLKYNIRI